MSRIREIFLCNQLSAWMIWILRLVLVRTLNHPPGKSIVGKLRYSFRNPLRNRQPSSFLFYARCRYAIQLYAARFNFLAGRLRSNYRRSVRETPNPEIELPEFSTIFKTIGNVAYSIRFHVRFDALCAVKIVSTHYFSEDEYIFEILLPLDKQRCHSPARLKWSLRVLKSCIPFLVCRSHLSQFSSRFVCLCLPLYRTDLSERLLRNAFSSFSVCHVHSNETVARSFVSRYHVNRWV